MRNKKLLSLMFAIVFVFTMTATASAATSSKTTVSSSKSMGVALDKGTSGNSRPVSFRVSGLPENARVTRIEVDPGSLTCKGVLKTNTLTLASSNQKAVSVAWNGVENKKLSFVQFYNTQANGTYEIWFNATCLGGYISHGMVLNGGTMTYSRPSITVYYEY